MRSKITYLEDLELDLTSVELERFLFEYYNTPVNISEDGFSVEPYKKGWGIDGSLFILSLKYKQVYDDIKLHDKLIAKKYRKEKKGKYKKEIEHYKYASKYFYDINGDGEHVRTYVRNYNNGSGMLDDRRILILDYHEGESEDLLLKLGFEIKSLESRLAKHKEEKQHLHEEGNLNIRVLNQKLTEILSSGLKTTALLHAKAKECEDELPYTLKSNHFYGEKTFLKYLNLVFGDAYSKLDKTLKKKIDSAVDKLTSFYNGDDNSRILLTTTHGDLHNRNIVFDSYGRALLIGGSYMEEGVSSLDVAEQIINDVVYLDFSRLEEIIIDGYLKEKRAYEDKFKIKSESFSDQFFVGATMISSFLKILKTAAFVSKVKKNLPDQFERFLINEPIYRLVTDHNFESGGFLKLKNIHYNLSLLERVSQYTAENAERFGLGYLSNAINDFHEVILYLNETYEKRD